MELYMLNEVCNTRCRTQSHVKYCQSTSEYLSPVDDGRVRTVWVAPDVGAVVVGVTNLPLSGGHPAHVGGPS